MWTDKLWRQKQIDTELDLVDNVIMMYLLDKTMNSQWELSEFGFVLLFNVYLSNVEFYSDNGGNDNTNVR